MKKKLVWLGLILLILSWTAAVAMAQQTPASNHSQQQSQGISQPQAQLPITKADVVRDNVGGRGFSFGWWILLIVLVILLVGALPAWPYSNAWGYYPSGGIGIILIIILILLFLRW